MAAKYFVCTSAEQFLSQLYVHRIVHGQPFPPLQMEKGAEGGGGVFGASRTNLDTCWRCQIKVLELLDTSD